MPRVELMCWQSRQRRWIKKYKGKQYVVSCRQLGTDRTREASRARANEWWRAKRASLEQNLFVSSGSSDAWQALSEVLSNADDIAKRNGNLSQRASLATEQALVSRFQKALTEFPTPNESDDSLASMLSVLYDPCPGETPEQTLWLDRLAVLESRRARQLAALAAFSRLGGKEFEIHSLPPAVPRHSLRETMEAFLAHKLRQMDNGELSAGRYDMLDRATCCFADWFVDAKERATAGDITTNEINGDTLPDFRDFLKSEQRTKSWSDHFVANVFAIAKQLIKWAYGRGRLEHLPRNFDDKDLAVEIHNSKPRVLSVDISKQLLSTTEEHCRLYVLLALNAGFTQIDISDLLNSEVNWTEGRIIRKRSKTADCENVPEVNYLLWTETFRLLQKFRSEDTSPTSRALLNRYGQPLKTEVWREKRHRRGAQKGQPVIGADGKPVLKLYKTDAIRNSFFRLVGKLKLSPAPCFKQLRKCGVTTLKGLGVRAELRNEYLGHSLRSVREVSYEGDSPEFQAEFDAAIHRLGEAFGIVEF